MFKRILTAVLCFVFVAGLSTIVFAKKEKGEKPETVMEKISAPKGDLKDKIGLAFNIPSGIASARFWLTESIGIDAIAGIGVGIPAGYDFSFSIGSNIVFPIMEESNFALYLTPGLLVSMMTGSTTALPVIDESDMRLTFAFGAAIEAEAFIVKNLLSIGGSFGLSMGINVQSTTDKIPDPDVTTSSTNFEMGVGSSTGSVIVRIYM